MAVYECIVRSVVPDTLFPANVGCLGFGTTKISHCSICFV